MGCRCSIIDNPVENFGITEKTKRTQKEYFEISWIGRIVQQPKCVLDAVEIFKLVLKKIDNVHLHIIGMRDNEEIYKQLLESVKDISEKVLIEEFQHDISDVYKNADVILLTSASESFSNVLAEAKVFSRPVVMYELPWLRLSKDNTGVLNVRQKDIVAASESVIKLLSDRALWETYSDYAWKSIQPDMKRNVVQEWINLFDDVRAGKKDNVFIDSGASNVIKLLTDQLYGVGYPDYGF